MSWSFRYDPERELLVQRIAGAFSLEDLREFRRARLEQGIPHPARRCLSDLRGCHLDFTLEELRRNEDSGGAQETGGARTAVLVDEALLTAMTMMWGKMLEGVAEVKVFSTLEAAAQWLGLAVDEDDLRF